MTGSCAVSCDDPLSEHCSANLNQTTGEYGSLLRATSNLGYVTKKTCLRSLVEHHWNLVKHRTVASRIR